MRRHFLRSKLHRVTVTHSELDYEGSVAIDGDLLKAANIAEYERIDVYNVTNGNRFTTYAIRAEAGSGVISVNGAAAHKATPGDIVILCAFAELNENEVADFKPTLVYVDDKNRIKNTRFSIPEQAA